MANAVKMAVAVRCASGRVAEFVKDDGTSGTTYELVTGGTGLNQTSGVSLGDALSGETITHAWASCMGVVSENPAFAGCWITAPDGSVAAIIQGGGAAAQKPLQPLYRALKVSTGMQAKGVAENAGTGIVQAFVGVCYASGKHDVFQSTLSDASETSFTSVISGATWGQAGAGQTATAYYAILNNTNTINEDGNGQNFVYAQDAQGQLTGLMSPVLCASGGSWSAFGSTPIPISQNDTLKATYAT
jgi:hypothetical protein